MYLKNILLATFFITASSLLSANDVLEKSETTKTILNAIHSDEVKTIMQKLNSLIYEREYTELELQKLSLKQIELLINEATALSQTATNQPNITSLNDLNEEEQLAFNAMANQLKYLAKELKREVDSNHEEKVSDVYLKLESTCNTCHQLFRD